MQCLTQSLSLFCLKRSLLLCLPGYPGDIRRKDDLQGGEKIKERLNESERVNASNRDYSSWKLGVIVKSG